MARMPNISHTSKRKFVFYIVMAISSWFFIFHPLIGLPDVWRNWMFFGKIHEEMFVRVLFPYYVTIGLGVIIDVLLLKEI